ncbi:hypothetical protein Tco_0366231 [Tanacetum coccineum]
MPLLAPSSPLLLPATDRMEDVSEADVPLRKRDMEERAPTTLEDLSKRVTDLAATLAQDTHEIYSEARHARQAWSQAMDCNKAVHTELLAYRTEGHDRTRELEPARDPEHQDGHKDVGSTSMKMPPKRSTTPMSNAAIKALVARSVADALAEHEANKNRNGDDSHDSGTGSRRIER